MRLGGGGGIGRLVQNWTATQTIFNVLKLGGGGFVIGIDIAADGTKVCRTDTYGAYTCSNSNPIWRQVCTTNSLGPANSGVDQQAGCYEIVIAPNNTSRFYMMFNGYVYRSDNSGFNWTRTGFSQVTANVNGVSGNNYGPRIAVDPANADIVYASSPSSGLFVSTNAGVSFSQVSSVGTATIVGGGSQSGGHAICFDSSSSVSGGKTQGIYVCTYGSGVYHSSNAGTTWALTGTAGMPTTFRHMRMGSTGVLWITDDTGGATNLHKYTGSWSNVSDANGPFHSIAIDPADPTHVVVATNAGVIDVTSNSGSTWSGVFNGFVLSNTAVDVPWLGATSDNFKSNGDQQFDPSSSNLLYFCWGIAVGHQNPPTTLQNYSWTTQTAGIEQLPANHVISPWIVGSKPVVSVWDRNGFYITNPNAYPVTQESTTFTAGWGLDWCSSAPGTVVILANWNGTDTSGISTDGGQTWTPFGSAPSTNTGGCIAASTPSNFVWAPSTGSAHIYYTTNGGSSWTQCPGLPTSGWGDNDYNNRTNVAADRVLANTFYAYSFATSGAGGFFKSTNSGAAWTQVNSTNLPNDGFGFEMKCVPGHAGHLFFTTGEFGAPHPANVSFYRSVDGGITRVALSNVLEVFTFGFGAPKPGGSGYPALYIVGWVSQDGGVTYNYGIWRSDNADQATPTWTQVGDGFPLGSFDHISCIDGDANTFGEFYLGKGGSGYTYGILQ